MRFSFNTDQWKLNRLANLLLTATCTFLFSACASQTPIASDAQTNPPSASPEQVATTKPYATKLPTKNFLATKPGISDSIEADKRTVVATQNQASQAQEASTTQADLEAQLEEKNTLIERLELKLKRAQFEYRKLESRVQELEGIIEDQDDSTVDMYAALAKVSTELIMQRYIPSILREEIPGPYREEINQLVFILYGDNSKSLATRREILKHITRLEVRNYLAMLTDRNREDIHEFNMLLTQASKYDGTIKRQYFPAFLTALYAIHGKQPEDTQIWYPYLDWLLSVVEEEKEGKLASNEDYFMELIIRFNRGE